MKQVIYILIVNLLLISCGTVTSASFNRTKSKGIKKSRLHKSNKDQNEGNISSKPLEKRGIERFTAIKDNVGDVVAFEACTEEYNLEIIVNEENEARIELCSEEESNDFLGVDEPIEFEEIIDKSEESKEGKELHKKAKLSFWLIFAGILGLALAGLGVIAIAFSIYFAFQAKQEIALEPDKYYGRKMANGVLLFWLILFSAGVALFIYAVIDYM